MPVSIGALFFLSGASSLIYQVVWVRMLVVVFGTSVYAVSTVLAAFMAGLAIGSVGFGRRIDRGGNGLRTYAGLELGIGLFALAFPLILGGLEGLHTQLYRALEGSPYAFALARFVIGFLVLLVPTTLMGGTLPVLSKSVVRELSGVGRGVGSLYALNTFGAVAGVILAAFVLIEQLGVRGTTWLAAAINVTIAGVAWWLARGRAMGDASAAVAAAAPAAGRSGVGEERTPSPLLARLVFWGYAVSGFTALGYEVVWTRLLSMALGLTTTQSLSAILVVFLFGLAAGGAVGARLVDRWRRPYAAFGVLELLLGLFGAASIGLFAAIPAIRAALGPAFSWEAHMVRLLVVVVTVILLPTFVMGVLFPVAGRLHVVKLGTLGRRVGGIYAVNTAGAIVGAFIAGFVLIPLVGTQTTILALAGINTALGAVVLAADGELSQRLRAGVIAALAAPVILLSLLLPSTLVVGLFAPPQTELRYHDEAAGGTVTVLEYPNGIRLLKVNGAGEVPTDHASIQTFRLLGNLPLLLHPRPQEVLVIAFGGGVTLAAVERHRPERIDCVEIVPGVVQGARWFADWNDGVYDRIDGGRLRLIVDDGRNHVLRTEHVYDVIISDSTHPSTADSWVLYTQEFYRLCRQRLTDGGIFAQWLPLHGLSVDDYKMILRTFQSVFPHASVWLTKGYTVLLATPEPLAIDVARLAQRLEAPEVNGPLEEVDLGDPVSLLSTLVLDETALAAYVGPGAVNTDDRPHISFGDRLRSGTQGGLPATMSLIPLYRPERIAGRLVHADGEDVERLERRCVARRHSLVADVALSLGERQRASNEARRALSIDPGEPGALRVLRELPPP